MAILRIIKIGFWREWKSNYPSWWIFVASLFGSLATMLVYFYTARAFAPKMSFFSEIKVDYFSYVVLGELVLLIPTSIFTWMSRQTKQMVFEGTFEPLIFSGMTPIFTYLYMCFPQLLILIINLVLSLFFASVFFGFSLPASSLFYLSVYQIFALPSFFALGILGVSMLLRFGRGEKLIYAVSNAASVFAGVYFPLQVFSPKIQPLLERLSPFSFLLLSSRRIVTKSESLWDLIRDLGVLTIWGIGLVIFASLLLNWSIEYRRRLGSPLVFAS